MLELRVEESQGFRLPRALKSNDPSLRISSLDNIPMQVIKVSPMVGDSPDSGHKFCMYQHERGVHTQQPICDNIQYCNPPLVDPCSAEELRRCGCEPTTLNLLPIVIEGFQLLASDQISFVHQSSPYALLEPGSESECESIAAGSGALSPFTTPTKTVVNEARDTVTYSGISSIKTGYFRICIRHDGKMYSAGMVVVRPSCPQPQQVMVDGTCVEHCPKTKVPVAGECQRQHLPVNVHKQAIMLRVKMGGEMANGALADRSTTDAERRYYIYRYTYELARLLNADPLRIRVESLSNGSLTVNTVFTEVVDNSDGIGGPNVERSPLGLINLLTALQMDTSSQLHHSSFFKDIDRFTFLPHPDIILARKCDDDIYRVFCPYKPTMSSAESTMAFAGAVLGVAILFTGICCLAWRIDTDAAPKISEDDMEKVERDWKAVDPLLQLEYATSWLEGRFMGEKWESKRQNKYLALEAPPPKKKG
jgi:hypothetical protein